MAKKEIDTPKSFTKSELIAHIRKVTPNPYASMINESQYYDKRWFAPTNCLSLNMAGSGLVEGGATPGISLIAGPSKHFKSGMILEFAAAFQAKFPEGIIIFYDSERGTPPKYLRSRGIDMNGVWYEPITDIEEMQFSLVQIIESLPIDTPIFIMVDSLGNLASKKEKEDMIKGDAKVDMTRGKAFKSFYRVVTPILSLKNIPLYGIAHTYDTQETYSKKVVSGGTGQYLAADNVWIIGREQVKDKDGKTVIGYDFKINVDKSRFVKEKSQFILEVRWGGPGKKGIYRYSGMLDLGVELGYILRPTAQKYQFVNPKTGEIFDKELNRIQAHYFDKGYEWLFENTDFAKALEEKFALPEDDSALSSEAMIEMDEDDASETE